MAGKTKQGRQTPRISYVQDWAYTDGADCAKLASSYGLAPDPWQRRVLDAWLARDEYDKFVHSTCGLSVPRQNGKNAILEQRELFGMAIIGEQILHTAHEVKTARKAFLRLASFFEDERRYPELAEMVKSIRRTNGQEAIVLTNGGAIEFSARSRSAGRGFTADCVVFDEAQELTEEQIEAMLPTLAAAPLDNRQFIYTGTPPAPNSPGTAFRRSRAHAIDKSDTNLSWHEWSVEEVGDVTDVKRWYQTNPALGIRITEEFVNTEFNNMTAEGFARERLGYWEDVLTLGDKAIDMALWDASKVKKAPEDGNVCYALKFSHDACYVALCAAVKVDDVVHVELVKIAHMEDGLNWIVEFVLDRQKKSIGVAIDGMSYAGACIKRLADAGVRRGLVLQPRVQDVISSSSMLLDGIKTKRVTHISQEPLDKAAHAATIRKIGSNGGFGFAGSDAFIIDAFALAIWASYNAKIRPGRKMRLL